MVAARIALLVAVVIWGWTFVATKVCLGHLEPLTLLSLRFLIAVPVLLAIVVARKVRLRFTRHRGRLATGSLLFALHFAVQITGLEYTSATNTGWIIAVTPLVIAVLAFLILRERIGRRAILGIVVSTAGILVLVSRGDPRNLEWARSLGDGLILASAHTWALYTIAIRDVTRSHDPLAVTFAVLLPATLLVTGGAIATSGWSGIWPMPGDVLLALLFLAVFGTALAHWFWQAGVARVGAAEAGLFLFLEPVATTGLAVPYLGEYLGASTVAGGLLVVAGVALGQYRGNRVRRSSFSP